MGRQIRFFLCDTMRAAIEDEGQRRGVTLVTTYSPEEGSIQYSNMAEREGRLWTEAGDPTNYNALCRAIKKGAVYDHELGLWVKRVSYTAFVTFKEERQKAIDELVEKNRKYAIEVLGGRPVKDSSQ
ncbi:MAG TPA: hypothetical protein VKS79_02785 [Gemmataceae bacterium]|nr:hypothetical protein [Gemmataceae bacterium]